MGMTLPLVLVGVYTTVKCIVPQDLLLIQICLSFENPLGFKLSFFSFGGVVTKPTWTTSRYSGPMFRR